jgi:hypothetical protein
MEPRDLPIRLAAPRNAAEIEDGELAPAWSGERS